MKALVRCDCGHEFEAAEEFKGGYVNCPACGRAAAVPGLRDPLWRLWQGLGLLAVIGLGVLGYGAGGPLAAVAVGIAGLGLLWLVSRAF